MWVRASVSFALSVVLVFGTFSLWFSCIQGDTKVPEKKGMSVEFVRLRRDVAPEAAHREPPRREKPRQGVAAEASVSALSAAEVDSGGGDRERYDFLDENAFESAIAKPRSTFALDVDTASYTNVRRFLGAGDRPPPGAVRIEELINYFRYDHPRPEAGEPLAVRTELAEAPWRPEHRLLLIGIQAETLRETELPPRNLVFLIDVSGSMQSPDKLALVKRGLTALAERLTSADRVAIAVYAGASGLVLPPTSGADRGAILAALGELEAGGSTNGGEGIRLAYRVARQHFDPGAINRVILATDGDFNVGTTSRSDLVHLIERERDSGVFLTVLGVGTGNLNDADMEALSRHGNGNYAYLDSVAEARRVLVSEAGGTLVTVAKDVKIQVEFNPARVGAWRLIGYENRLLADRDFDDDAKDAGELGAGHSVTALYEIVPVGLESGLDAPGEAPLRYQRERATETGLGSELALVRLRYQPPDGGESRLLEHVVPLDVLTLSGGQRRPAFRLGAGALRHAAARLGARRPGRLRVGARAGPRRARQRPGRSPSRVPRAGRAGRGDRRVALTSRDAALARAQHVGQVLQRDHEPERPQHEREHAEHVRAARLDREVAVEALARHA